jgi:hypothetical protein
MRIQRIYVSIMMLIVGRALSAISRVDEEAIEEIKGLPEDYIIQMVVVPGGPGFKVRTVGDGTLEVANNTQRKVDLSIKFKHLSHAFSVLSFQEGTAEAFTKDRMIADGELSHSIRLVRILNKMEAIILPEFIAKRAVKRYPDNLGCMEKITKALRIYARVIRHLIIGS